MPEISVIMPVCNSAQYLREALDSVIAQTFTDWELLAVNEYGSDDGSAGIVEEYAARDPRVRLIQNTERLGLAESLNRGFRLAQGKYLARLDADDLAFPMRFEKQYAFMESAPEIGICGTYQHHFGKGVDWVHKPPVRPKDMKAALLFSCNLCHSTLMLRRNVVFENNLFYDGSFLAEDFELWTRAIRVTQIANIPEVLGAYRISGTNITDAKKRRLMQESGRIVANNLKTFFGIELSDEQVCYFQDWENHFIGIGKKRRREQLDDLESILREIYKKNEQRREIDSESLLNQLTVAWRYAKLNMLKNWSGEELAHSLDEVFMDGKYKSLIARYKVFRRNNPSFWLRVKKIVKKLILHPLAVIPRRITRGLVCECMDDLDYRIDKKVERWTWDRYKRIRQDFVAQQNRMHMLAKDFIPYHKGEKIRIGILFQIPSCWASIESVWELLRKDERFDARMYLFDLEQREPAQMAGAREFLEERNIPFISVDRFTFSKEDLHILIYQTPWDDTHRPAYLKSDAIAQLGFRIAYITYGLGYSASVWEGHRFSDIKFKAYPWKVFVFSPQMRFDHICLSPRGGQNVVGVGHPKFDAIANKADYPLEPEAAARVKGRKVVFVQIHFPAPDGNPSIPEADIHAYIEFLKKAPQYPELFFIVRPHPKLLEVCEQRGFEDVAEALSAVLTGVENVFCYDYPDYRPALFAADYVIGDRSALMLEAGALDVPVLYMTNFYYKEKLLPSVAPVFDSYYQGSSAYDIERFIDLVVLRGKDYKKEERRRAAREFLPPLDGQGSRRIVDALAEAIYKEGI